MKRLSRRAEKSWLLAQQEIILSSELMATMSHATYLLPLVPVEWIALLVKRLHTSKNKGRNVLFVTSNAKENSQTWLLLGGPFDPSIIRKPQPTPGVRVKRVASDFWNILKYCMFNGFWEAAIYFVRDGRCRDYIVHKRSILKKVLSTDKPPLEGQVQLVHEILKARNVDLNAAEAQLGESFVKLVLREPDLADVLLLLDNRMDASKVLPIFLDWLVREVDGYISADKYAENLRNMYASKRRNRHDWLPQRLPRRSFVDVEEDKKLQYLAIFDELLARISISEAYIQQILDGLKASYSVDVLESDYVQRLASHLRGEGESALKRMKEPIQPLLG